jgi:RyR domain
MTTEEDSTGELPRERSSIRSIAVRTTELSRNLDLFLAFAVAGVLGNRFFLVLTGYPQVGNGTLHISHAIWGGVMMVIAIGAALSYIAPGVRIFVAIVGGAGLGWFVDELGKFITRDVNYFFRPTLALIYTLFVALYLVSRSLRRRRFDADEGLLNALEAVKAAVIGRLDEPTRREALALLDQTCPNEGFASKVRDLLDEATTLPAREPGRATRLLRRWQGVYARWTEQRAFVPTIAVIFAVLAISDLAQVLTLFLLGAGIHSYTEWVTVGSSLVSLLFVIIGACLLPRSRLAAYRWFEASVLVAIFVTQVFLFADKQLAGVINILIALVVWGALRSAMRLEQLARAVHEEYVQSRLAEGGHALDDPSLGSWDELPETLKASNRSQAMQIEKKLRAVGCALVPLHGREAAPFEFTDDEVELLARIEHDRWVDERRRSGWQFGGERDVRTRRTPYLVPWEQLSEAIRDLDRETALKLPRYAARTGQQIVRVQDGVANAPATPGS